jgi:hypothetical protein
MGGAESELLECAQALEHPFEVAPC